MGVGGLASKWNEGSANVQIAKGSGNLRGLTGM